MSLIIPLGRVLRVPAVLRAGPARRLGQVTVDLRPAVRRGDPRRAVAVRRVRRVPELRAVPLLVVPRRLRSSPTRCARSARCRAPTASSTGARASILARPTGPWDARYTLDGQPDPSPWPKLQIDGLGLFLCALRRRGNYSRWDEPARSSLPAGSSTTGRSRASTGGRSARASTPRRSGASATASARTRSGARRSRAPTTGSTARCSSSARRRSSSASSSRCLVDGGVWRTPRRRVLRRRRVAAPDRDARTRLRRPRASRRRPRLPRLDRGARCAERRSARAGHRINLLRPERYQPWVEKWGSRRLRCSGRMRCTFD